MFGRQKRANLKNQQSASFLFNMLAPKSMTGKLTLLKFVSYQSIFDTTKCEYPGCDTLWPPPPLWKILATPLSLDML